MTTPYFYIIEENSTKRKYAGARWQKNCHPSELLKEGGYTTSSPKVNKIIQETGLSAFNIVTIKEIENPREYETIFLKENDCAKSSEWINQHNNDRLTGPDYGTEEFKKLMLEKYGVDHNTKIPEVRKKMTETQKQFHKNNPEFIKARALKVAANRKKNGTTGLGEKHVGWANNGKYGKHVRTEEIRLKQSKSRTGKGMGENNGMANAENRAKVAASKIGRKKVIHTETGQVKMVYPDNIPDGYVLKLG